MTQTKQLDRIIHLNWKIDLTKMPYWEFEEELKDTIRTHVYYKIEHISLIAAIDWGLKISTKQVLDRLLELAHLDEDYALCEILTDWTSTPKNTIQLHEY